MWDHLENLQTGRRTAKLNNKTIELLNPKNYRYD